MTRSSIVGFALCCGLGGVLLPTFSAHAEVIHDSLWIHDDNLMDAGVGHAIGGWRPFPGLGTIDSQVVEDFTLTQQTRLTVGVIDVMSHDGTVPAEGIWVQVYADAGGRPAEETAADWVALPSEYEAEEISSPLNFRAWRITINLSDADLDLDEGTWWVDFQPLDIKTTGDWFWSIGSVSIEPIGFPSHVRDGWEAHGNNYYGLWGSTTWIPHSFRGNAVLSWRLEGDTSGGECTGREKLSASCADSACGPRVVAKVKRGLPDAEIRFRIDGGQERRTVVNARGKAKVKWCGLTSGPHTVSLVECGASIDTNCP